MTPSQNGCRSQPSSCQESLIVEFVGLPGCGKSSVSHGVAERVRGVCERYSAALAEAAQKLKGGDNE